MRVKLADAKAKVHTYEISSEHVMLATAYGTAGYAGHGEPWFMACAYVSVMIVHVCHVACKRKRNRQDDTDQD